MPDQEQVLDCIGDQKIPDLAIVGEFVCDFFFYDLIVQGIKFDVVQFIFQWAVYGVIVIDPLFENLDCVFPLQVIEFRKRGFSLDAGLQDVFIVIDALYKEKGVPTKQEADFLPPIEAHIRGIKYGHLSFLADVTAGPPDVHKGNLFSLLKPLFVFRVIKFRSGCVFPGKLPPQISVIKDPSSNVVLGKVLFQLVRYGGFSPGGKANHDNEKFFSVHNIDLRVNNQKFKLKLTVP